MREIMLAVSRAGARVIRVNAGKGWAGPSTRYPDGSVLIKPAQPFHGVPDGVSDLIGWTADGHFLAIEVKTSKGRVTAEQTAWLAAVAGAGGRAGVARSIEDALAIVRGSSEP